MREFLKKLQEQMLTLIKRMSPAQRMSLAALAAVLVVSLVFLVTWSMGSNWTPLLGNSLPPEQSSQVMMMLDSAGIPYQADGGRILVKSEDFAGVRARFYQDLQKQDNKDLYKFLYENSLTETPSQRKARLDRAREVELAESISGMPGIYSAKVIIKEVRTPLIRLKNAPRSTASVNIRLKSGQAGLDPQTVQAVADLVAFSVGNMKPHDVGIVADGVPYKVREQDSLSWVTNQMQKDKEEVEKYFDRKIEDHFSSWLPGVVSATNVRLVRESSETDSRKRSSVEPLEKSTVEEYESKGVAEGYTPGVTSNIVAPKTGGTGNTEVKHSMTDTDWIFPDEIVEHKKSIANHVGGISLFVTIPFEAAVRQLPRTISENYDEANPDHESALKEKLAEYKKGVMQVTGAATDDVTINVAKFSFPVEKTPPAPFGDKAQEFFAAHWGEIALALIALGAIAMIAVSVRRSLPQATPKPIDIAQGMIPQGPVGEEAEPEEKEVSLPGVEVTEREKQVELMHVKISDVARKEPKQVVGLLRTWLKQEE